jgi:hypothetical protein
MRNLILILIACSAMLCSCLKEQNSNYTPPPATKKITSQLYVIDTPHKSGTLVVTFSDSNNVSRAATFEWSYKYVYSHHGKDSTFVRTDHLYPITYTLSKKVGSGNDTYILTRRSLITFYGSDFASYTY